MLAAGERIAGPAEADGPCPDAARTYGKSDRSTPWRSLAALRNPDLPVAHAGWSGAELRLLVDHREDLVAERTRCLNRLRWHLAPWDLPAFAHRVKNLDAITARLGELLRTRRAYRRRDRHHVRDLTVANERSKRDHRHRQRACSDAHGPGRCRSAHRRQDRRRDRRRSPVQVSDALRPTHNGTAPLPVWSGNRERHRLSRTGNRQLNAAIHRIAITQMRCHDDAIAYLERRTTQDHKTKTEAIRGPNGASPDVVEALLAGVNPLKQHPQTARLPHRGKPSTQPEPIDFVGEKVRDDAAGVGSAGGSRPGSARPGFLTDASPLPELRDRRGVRRHLPPPLDGHEPRGRGGRLLRRGDRRGPRLAGRHPVGSGSPRLVRPALPLGRGPDRGPDSPTSTTRTGRRSRPSAAGSDSPASSRTGTEASRTTWSASGACATVGTPTGVRPAGPHRHAGRQHVAALTRCSTGSAEPITTAPATAGSSTRPTTGPTVGSTRSRHDALDLHPRVRRAPTALRLVPGPRRAPVGPTRADRVRPSPT